MAILHPGVTKPAAGVMHTKPGCFELLLGHKNWQNSKTWQKMEIEFLSTFNIENATIIRILIKFIKDLTTTSSVKQRTCCLKRVTRKSSTEYHKGPLLCKPLPKPLLACNCAHRSTNAGGLALQHALKRQPDHHGGSWSHQSGGDSTSGHTICDGQGWTTVESQPTKPKEAATQDDERDIGRAHFLLHVPTWSQNSTSDETRHTWADVNHCSTGKVQSSHLANPAARAPNPVAKRGIDQQWPKSQHDAVGTETHAFY